MKRILLLITCFCFLQAEKITSGYTWETFDRRYKPWKDVYTEYKTNLNGSLIFRANQAERFGLLGRQFEMDWYPKGDNHYWYLNAGFSGTDLYPDSRYGLEYFQKLEQGWEASLGLRELNFHSTHAHIYTSSLGRYWGDWWAAARAYSTKDSGSLELTIRRYLSNADNYLSVFGGGGTSVEDDSLASTYYIAKKQKLGVSYQMSIGDWIIKLARTSESLEYIKDTYTNRVSTAITGSYQF